MAFLNKKEQVLDIQLTQHGKRLLSKGRLKPAYYAFFDDDIIYDSEYGGFEENRTDISERIRNETPSMGAQYAFGGLQSSFEKSFELVASGQAEVGDRILEPIPERHYALAEPIGTSDLTDENLPAWNVKFHKGLIDTVTNVKQESYHHNIRIPQLNLTSSVFRTSVVKADPPEPIPGLRTETILSEQSDSFSNINLAARVFDDGTSIRIDDDFLLIQVDEENVPPRNDNFDIEFYMIEDDQTTGNEVLIPLSFEKKRESIVNGILLDDDESRPESNSLKDPSFIGHYFNVYVDREISPDILCDYVPKGDREAGFPGEVFECDERIIEERRDIYETDATIEEDC